MIAVPIQSGIPSGLVCSGLNRAGLVVTALICAVLATGCNPRPTGSTGASPDLATGTSGDRATVVSVVDGDTVELSFGDQVERARLLGVDAPESVHPTVPIQCFGPEASAELAAVLPPGTTVRVERDVEARDRYGRLLLYLYRTEDGLFINQWLLHRGLADTSFYEPNTALAAPLIEARSAARAGRVGLWGSCDGPDQPLQ